ncbi:Na+/H+ antiporter subunit E [Silanimonas sp.]|jgi:multicomponent K+:H+ antiporter subunit E|uniref:Na+/H+ antiporter subunit E n=1 Tax=Silanimonas sp. TaxID=1929290 RepID=UPI0037CB8D5D
MRALIPHPVSSLAVAALWLLLNGLSNGQLVLAVLFALALPRLLPSPAIPSPRLAAPVVAAKLVLVVLYDIVKANLEVAVRILGPESRIRPTFVWVPLDIASPQGIAVFASIITMTPGTLSCEVSEDRRWLLVHAFHADDAAAVVADVKSRYEAPLREIFR